MFSLSFSSPIALIRWAIRQICSLFRVLTETPSQAAAAMTKPAPTTKDPIAVATPAQPDAQPVVAKPAAGAIINAAATKPAAKPLKCLLLLTYFGSHRETVANIETVKRILDGHRIQYTEVDGCDAAERTRLWTASGEKGYPQVFFQPPPSQGPCQFVGNAKTLEDLDEVGQLVDVFANIERY